MFANKLEKFQRGAEYFLRGVEYFGIVIEYFPKVIEFFTKVIEIRAYLMEIEQTLDIPKGGACRSALPLSQSMATERASRTQELMEFGENKKGKCRK